jgi:hypothetical protein
MARQKKVAVVGDVTVDWQVILANGPHGSGLDALWAWSAPDESQLAAHAGGAALLREIVEAAVADRDPSLEVSGPSVPPEALARPDAAEFTRLVMAWSPVPAPKTAGGPAWRIVELLGRSAATRPHVAVPEAQGEADLIVIDDMALGYRDDPAQWPVGLSHGRPPRQVLLMTTVPLMQGPLWERLVERCADVLTVVVLTEDLRKDSLPVGYPLSWEQLYRDVVRAVRGCGLAEAARVIVPVGLLGAVILERDGGSRLLFSPRTLEGDERATWPGAVVGYALCLAAALAAETAAGGIDIAAATNRGLAAARALHVGGYDLVSEDGNLRLRFPLERVRQELREASVDLPSVAMDVATGDDHRILTAVVAGADLMAMAETAAVRGPEHLEAAVPVETVGAWSSVDRDEIESMRAVRGIVSEYVRQWRTDTRLERPLSIAVFGPPGAGKSFAVKQMARALLPGLMKELEFNLSQFHDESELGPALHRVRDAVLQQYLPLVFWDEFDTALQGVPLGWLRHFLAPMQDGAFLQNGSFHPIGPAIFVFAGGTSATLAEFIAGDEAQAKQAKKPDFLSRLRAYVNVYGPNPQSEHDVAYILRRALLLRSLLQRKAPQIVDGGLVRIDPGVLRAFLRADGFTHGARSMEAIVDMSALAGKSRFERASLPPANQLALHVGAERFLALIYDLEGGA